VNLSRLSIRNWATRLATVVVLTGSACLGAWLLVPKVERSGGKPLGCL
jgi:hypothetical protein